MADISSCWFMNLRICSSGPQNGFSETRAIIAVLAIVVVYCIYHLLMAIDRFGTTAVQSGIIEQLQTRTWKDPPDRRHQSQNKSMTTPQVQSRQMATTSSFSKSCSYFNYTSELGQDVVLLFLVFPVSSIHEIKCLVHREELALHSMTPLAVSIKQLVLGNVPL